MEEYNKLSKREWEVVKLLQEGKSNKLIAAALHISESTVEFHLKNIYAKQQVSSRMELILKLRESTVAHGGNIAENGDQPNTRNWATALRETVSRIREELKMNGFINTEVRNGGDSLTFFESIRTCFIKYADFNGRASRSEFWWFMLFITLVDSALVYLSKELGAVFLIATLLPLLAAGTRRLRDSGKSGWWQLFLLAPVGGIVILGFLWALPPTNPLPEETLSTPQETANPG
jgi:DNA-binding CsgD family transcriptional regulator